MFLSAASFHLSIPSVHNQRHLPSLSLKRTLFIAQTLNPPP